MQNKYDAIVVGTGISGGWAAKELTEKGLKTLVLERGRMITHVDDYHTADMDPWDFEGGDTITQDALQRQFLVGIRTSEPRILQYLTPLLMVFAFST